MVYVFFKLFVISSTPVSCILNSSSFSDADVTVEAPIDWKSRKIFRSIRFRDEKGGRKEKEYFFSPDELGTDCLLRFLPLIVRLQLKDVPVDELLPVWPEGQLQRQRLLARNLCCQPACNYTNN